MLKTTNPYPSSAHPSFENLVGKFKVNRAFVIFTILGRLDLWVGGGYLGVRRFWETLLNSAVQDAS